MKANLICWLPTISYNLLEEYGMKTVHLLLENKIAPLLDSSYSKAIWEDLGKPDTLRYITYGEETKQTLYWDEPISSEEIGVLNEKGFTLINGTIGETSTETIQQLIDAGCKNITYTAYGWHLFRIAEVNIRMPFTSQLNTWKKLERLYGKRESEFFWYNEKTREHTPIMHESKFTFCWIMLNQDRHWKKLLEWATSHNKIIGIVAPDSKQNNPEWIYKQLQSFIKTYKEVTE